MDPVSSEPDPLEPVPAGPLFVPVRPGSPPPASVLAARLFRTPLGDRTAVAFTSPDRLARVLGAGQRWIVLSEPALRALTAPLGVRRLVVDPQFSAPRAATLAPQAARTATRTADSTAWATAGDPAAAPAPIPPGTRAAAAVRLPAVPVTVRVPHRS